MIFAKGSPEFTNQINVYELGSSYLKLRSALHLTTPMPEIDPAIYNLRFALKLDLGTDINAVATDASRLVRRFKADWMTQGRRPAGVCGACMVIAARMSNYLRTPEEVVQVVKVSPSTIRKRLLEFAQTKVASKTVAEWRSLSDRELATSEVAEDPPVVKKARAKAESIRIEALRKAEREVLDQQREEDDSDVELLPRRKKRRKTNRSRDVSDSEMLRLANDFEDMDEEDPNLPALDQVEYVSEINLARDNPSEVAADVRREASAFHRQNRHAMEEVSTPNSSEMHNMLSSITQEDANADGDEKVEDEPDTDASDEVKRDETVFDAWDDTEATLDHLGKKYFTEEERLLKLTTGQMRERVRAWLKDRDPRQVVEEIQIVERARKRREAGAREKAEEDFPDLDDTELEAYYMMSEDDVRARARMWLSVNSRWLEEDKGESYRY